MEEREQHSRCTFGRAEYPVLGVYGCVASNRGIYEPSDCDPSRADDILAVAFHLPRGLLQDNESVYEGVPVFGRATQKRLERGEGFYGHYQTQLIG